MHAVFLSPPQSHGSSYVSYEVPVQEAEIHRRSSPQGGSDLGANGLTKTVQAPIAESRKATKGTRTSNVRALPPTWSGHLG